MSQKHRNTHCSECRHTLKRAAPSQLSEKHFYATPPIAQKFELTNILSRRPRVGGSLLLTKVMPRAVARCHDDQRKFIKVLQHFCNRFFRDCTAQKTAVLEYRKKIQKKMRKVSSSPRTPTAGDGATRTHKSPEVHRTRNEALKQRRRQEHSRQRNDKNRSDLMNNCAPPICTLDMERHRLASFTLPVPLTYSTVETQLPRTGTRGLPLHSKRASVKLAGSPQGRKLCHCMFSEVELKYAAIIRTATVTNRIHLPR